MALARTLVEIVVEFGGVGRRRMFDMCFAVTGHLPSVSRLRRVFDTGVHSARSIGNPQSGINALDEVTCRYYHIAQRRSDAGTVERKFVSSWPRVTMA